MTGIAPGAYVRVTRGMYRGTTGRVVSLHAMESTAPYATVDVGDACVGVSVSALELVGAVPTVEQERDAAIAERARLRRELEALRDEAARLSANWSTPAELARMVTRLDTILRGGES